MSVVFPIQDKPRYAKYTATAGQTMFAIPFEFQQNRDIKVQKTLAGEITPAELVQVTDYTVAGAGVFEGGSFTLVTAAAAGDVLEVWGEAVLDRITSVVQAGKFKAAAHDTEHDRHRIIQQELKRENERTVRGPLGYAAPEIKGTPTEGKALVYDADGNLIPGPDAGDIAAAQPSAAAAAASAAEAAGYVAQLAWRMSCRAATISNITLSGEQTVDGVALVTGNRCLVKNQAAAEDNGIYVVDGGAWARASDADAWDKLVSAVTVAEQGTANADTIWICTSDQGGTLGTTGLTWQQKLANGVVASDDTTFTGNITLANGLTVPALITVPQNFTLSNPGGSTEMQINKAGSGFLARLWGLANNVRRWAFDLGDSTVEGGSNTGSDAALKAYDDFGAFLFDVVKFRRHNRQTLLYGELTFPNDNIIAWNNGSVLAVGSGSPNGVVDARAGIYIQVDGGANMLWAKTNNVLNNTGWVVK
ncbi:hypothetical protein [Labrenzia sp. DG1229]|uniref:hypothetical protein n=1 Tax=Labrenzia sp. DG1229 TaxID=681847 RepID=UPI0006915175|nr:hypothetical protein [Labrenzia sp. DG1229]